MKDKVKLVTVGMYGSSVQANIMKAKLDAAGIDCALMSETLVNIMNINQVSGPIKLQVREEDEAAAKEVLAIIDTELLAEELATDDESAACPHCQSKDTVVALGHSNILSAVWMIFLGSFPFYNKKRYLCNTCKKYFKARPNPYK